MTDFRLDASTAAAGGSVAQPGGGSRRAGVPPICEFCWHEFSVGTLIVGRDQARYPIGRVCLRAVSRVENELTDWRGLVSISEH